MSYLWADTNAFLVLCRELHGKIDVFIVLFSALLAQALHGDDFGLGVELVPGPNEDVMLRNVSMRDTGCFQVRSCSLLLDQARRCI